MTSEELKEELLQTYMEYYVEGFKANDISLIDRMVEYPIAYIKDGAVKSLNEYPIDPGKLKQEKEWDHSTDWKF